ncbi:MAG: hypothetical protein R3C28_10900 [Pirellulaceae bacterium]
MLKVLGMWEAFAAIDRAMWDYNLRSRRSPASGQHYGAFTTMRISVSFRNSACEVRRAISPVGFEGMINWVKEFISQDGLVAVSWQH